MLTYTDPMSRREAIKSIQEEEYPNTFMGVHQYVLDRDIARCGKFPHKGRKLVFSIIYSIDGVYNEIRRYFPGKPFRMTENGKSEYDIPGFRHRKYCGILSREKFEKFIDNVCITAEDVETGGSIGAPGFGFGWAPAISFRDKYNEDMEVSAYVTPVMLGKSGKTWEFVEYDWERMRRAIINKYH